MKSVRDIQQLFIRYMLHYQDMPSCTGLTNLVILGQFLTILGLFWAHLACFWHRNYHLIFGFDRPVAYTTVETTCDVLLLISYRHGVR